MHFLSCTDGKPHARGDRRNLLEEEMGLDSRNEGGFSHHASQRGWVGRPDDGEWYRRERGNSDDFDRRQHAASRSGDYTPSGGRMHMRGPSYSPDRRVQERSGGREYAGPVGYSSNGGGLPVGPSQRLLEGERYSSKDPFHGSAYSHPARDASDSLRRPLVAENHNRGTCHPCVFYAVGRCRNGGECRNCHEEEHSDTRSPLFALDVLHRKGLCIVCIDFKRKGICNDPDRAHRLLYCHHPQHRPNAGDFAEDRGRDSAACTAGPRRALEDLSPKVYRSAGYWGEAHISAGRCRQREEEYDDCSGRESARRRLLSPELCSRGYGSSMRAYSGVAGGSKCMSPPGKDDYCGHERGTGGGSGGRTASLCVGRGVQPPNSRLHPPRVCEERRCVPCSVFFSEGRCRRIDCARCHEPCHGSASSPLFYHRVLHDMNRCEPCRAFADGCCPLSDGACCFCHDRSHAGDRLSSLKPAAMYYPARREPYEATSGRAAGGPSYRGAREVDSFRRREPLGVGRDGLDKGSRGGDSGDRNYASRGGPRVQRVERGGAALGGTHPDRCVPCLWYFQHVTGCGKGRACSGCHHEDHRDPQSDLHPSKRLHVLGRCVPCRNYFKGICPRQAEACGFCHHEEHRSMTGSKGERVREEERKEQREQDGSRQEECGKTLGGLGCSVETPRNKEGESRTVSVTSGSGEKVDKGEPGGPGESEEPREEERKTEKEADKEGYSGKLAKNGGTKRAVHYVRQRGQNEPRAHERGVCRPCAFYFIGPQGCLKRDRCPDCHHADHANPHSSAHPSKLLHLKGTCRPCISFQRGTCTKAAENCVYCHHSSHLHEACDDRESGDKQETMEESDQVDAAEFPVQDLGDGPVCCQEEQLENSPCCQQLPGESYPISDKRGGESEETPVGGDRSKVCLCDEQEMDRGTESTDVVGDHETKPEQHAGGKGNIGDDETVAGHSCPLIVSPRPDDEADKALVTEEGANGHNM
ncbi:hypothetical protein TGVAND_212220 [Toxoplasma gondii VAND]|uniref:C3H1-type domain-containing protein n=1 Tax=Toxoplasma gondii VAND TaxID=933077 RepID=A0A086QM53_TOXGO|nr:hypothetical protein TGVAND_212220 [Toxoplasma gondii VAND]